MKDAGRLGPEAHEEAWRRFDGGSFDVLVVGAGVTGARVALDATTRGLSTALVEARDFCSGTSSHSSKLADEPALGAPVPCAEEYLAAEVHAVTHEGALHLDDILTRRPRISIETTHRGVDSARAVADIVAPVPGWGPETVTREVDTYLTRVESERASQKEDEDVAADAARLLAPELRRDRRTQLR